MFGEPKTTAYDLKFSIQSIPIRVNPFFWLIALILGWSADVTPLELVIWIACAFISVLVHEYGHAIAARHFGAVNLRIFLHGMGGTMVSNSPFRGKQRIIELVCGPLAGFILMGAAFISLILAKNLIQQGIFLYSISQLVYINLMWGILNLIPVYPLDGGQILDEVIHQKKPWDSKILTYKLSIIISIVIGLAFGFFALLGWFDWFPMLVFLMLAAMNFQLLRFPSFGEDNKQEHHSQNSWEKDPDWWKR